MASGGNFLQRLFRGNRLAPSSTPTPEPIKKSRVSPRISLPGTGHAGQIEIPRGFSLRDIPKLRQIGIADEDIAGAIRDLQVLAIPGYRIRVAGRSASKALADLNLVKDTWFQGGFDSLLNNQIFELTVAGASSIEWYPDKSKSGVGGAAVVPAESIQIRRPEDVVGPLEYWQIGNRSPIMLNSLTYRYLPVITIGDNPIGIPLMYSSMNALTRKAGMLSNIDRMLKVLGLTGIVHAGVPIPKPEDLGYNSEEDPNYQTHVVNQLSQVRDLLFQGEEQGILVTPLGTEVNVLSPARDIAAAMTGWIDNEHRVWSGARTMPFMRGRSESLSETWAKVAYPIIMAEAKNLQNIVKNQIEFGLNLHLRLRGYNAVASIEFLTAESPFREVDARASKVEAERDKIYAELFGPMWLEKRSEEIGLEDWTPDMIITPPPVPSKDNEDDTPPINEG